MKVVLQDGAKDCGICCLLSVIRYYGGDVSKEYLRELTNTTRFGVSAYQLICAAEKLGFDASGMKGDLSKIEKNNLPCLSHIILHKSYKHFVTIYDISERLDRVLVMDPERGRRVFSVSEFRMLSSGYFIFLHPRKTLPVMLQKKFLRHTLLLFLKEQKLLLIFLSLLTFLYFVFQIITAFHFKYLLEFSISYQLSSPLFFLSCYLSIFYLLKEISNVLRNLTLMKWTCLLDAKITFCTYQQILLLPYFYYRNRTSGEVISRLKDLNVVKAFLAQCFSSIFSDFLGLFLFGFFLFLLNPTITVWAFLLFLFLIGINFLFKKTKTKYCVKIAKQEERVNSYLVESLANVDTIKGGHIEKRLRDVFMLKYQKLLETSYVQAVMNELSSFLQKVGYASFLIFFLGLGSFLVIQDEFSLGNFIVYQSVFQYFFNCFQKLLEIGKNYPAFLTSLERVEDLFMISSENFSGSSNYFFVPFEGNIHISDFSYQLGRVSLFDHLNLHIKSGQKILIMGESGSGKSTLMKMLMRYVEVPFGKIQIHNIDINHYHLEILRNQITYVTTSEFLFTDTLYSNITLNREVNKDKFQEVVRVTKVDEFAKNDTLQYQRPVEENGFNFSNGEKQRIILARALLRESSIYIFDEAFSQIDPEKEIQIIQDIFAYLKGKTIIVISHRTLPLSLFEQALKLEGGKFYHVKKL